MTQQAAVRDQALTRRDNAALLLLVQGFAERLLCACLCWGPSAARDAVRAGWISAPARKVVRQGSSGSPTALSRRASACIQCQHHTKRHEEAAARSGCADCALSAQDPLSPSRLPRALRLSLCGRAMWPASERCYAMCGRACRGGEECDEQEGQNHGHESTRTWLVGHHVCLGGHEVFTMSYAEERCAGDRARVQRVVLPVVVLPACTVGTLTPHCG